MHKIILTPTDNINIALNEFNINDPLEIILTPGEYRQKVKISHSNITLRGLEKENTKIIYNDFSHKIHEDDGLLYNTFRTATLTITGSNVSIENLTIENDSGYGPLIGQALAVAVYGTGNKFDTCHLVGHQDTLFIGPLPIELTERYAHILPADERTTVVGKHKFENCTIEGDVDFIFGSGDALFTNCNVLLTRKGYVTAPSHYHENQLGFIFYKCKISNVSDSTMVLGRPWRDYGRVTFIDCQITGLIENRYNDWSKEHFYFYEHPYVEDKLNHPITENKLKELLDQIKSW